jgi:hypothetical protein
LIKVLSVGSRHPLALGKRVKSGRAFRDDDPRITMSTSKLSWVVMTSTWTEDTSIRLMFPPIRNTGIRINAPPAKTADEDTEEGNAISEMY